MECLPSAKHSAQFGTLQRASLPSGRLSAKAHRTTRRQPLPSVLRQDSRQSIFFKKNKFFYRVPLDSTLGKEIREKNLIRCRVPPGRALGKEIQEKN